ncbi:glycosyltransferase family 4 protein [Candidatus Berkelbacteria bacterium]|nr:glycosyltransferase family 4 protein [Candidatus Berkelbacteria bacterium]
MKKFATLALVSQTLRRDLEDPLKYFKKLKILHFYTDASYGDMREEDFASTPIRYRDSAQLARLLEEAKPDIIQGPEPYASRLALKNAWIVAQYARRTRTPYFFPVFENRPVLEKFGWPVGLFMQTILGVYGRAAAGVINLNLGARANLIAAGVPEHKITRLNWGTWGIDVAEFDSDPKRRSTYPLVFFVGRVSEAKGVPDLLSAWPKILELYPKAKLVIGGPIDPQSPLNAQIKDSPATTFLGPIKNAELPRYFQEAWVTVAPSVTTKTWEEQVGMINLQSLACATPVVTTNSGAIPEYVGENHGAILVPEHAPETITRAVCQFLADAKRRVLAGQRGRRHVVKEYEVKKNVERDEEYVLSLLRKADHEGLK